MLRTTVLLLCLAATAAADRRSRHFNINLSPRQRLSSESSGFVFRGNRSRSDHFKLLELDGNSVLVGARNAVYNLSLPSLRVQQKLVWESAEATRLDCQRKGESEEVCQNYIRVLVKERDGRSLVCGTNAFSPLCRLYSLAPEGDYRSEREFDGTGVCPYDPRHNSTATLAADSADLFAATVTDRAASDPLIYRRSIDLEHPQAAGNQLRTQRYDRKTLFQPDFVSSFVDEDYVYFWFREIAVEAVDGAEASVYARVGRVCRSDRGGPAGHESYHGSWTTFLKARLNCSLPADTHPSLPFYFNQLQATSGLVRSVDGNKLVYAVLSTPANAVQMSAVCAFRMQDVAAIFETGAFLAQATETNLWLPVPEDGVPRPRPGQCTHNSKRLSPAVVKFVNLNSLMARPVPNYFSHPLFIDNSLGAAFTQIAVDGGVESVSGRRFDVMFLGTADGRVLKLVTVDGAQSVLVESVDVFPAGDAVRNLLVYDGDGGGDGRLVVVSTSTLHSLPLQHCARQTSCSGCVRLQDPYCAWDLRSAACLPKKGAEWSRGDYVQSVETGRSSLCPEGAIDPESYAVNDNYALRTGQVTGGGSPIYTAASMSIAVVVTLALALSLGFLLGFRLSAWRKATADGSSTSSGSDYDAHSMGLSRLTRHDAAAKAHQAHIYDEKRSYVPERLVGMERGESFRGDRRIMALEQRGGSATLGRPLPKSAAALTTSLHVPSSAAAFAIAEKNNLLSLSNGTLPKDYRVKKVYL